MKINMRRKRISIFLCLSLFLSFLWGCSQNTVTETDSTAGLKPIGEPPVSMKEVTQENYDGTITFRLKVPKDWMCMPNTDGGVNAISEESYEKLLNEAEQNQENGDTLKNYSSLTYEWEKEAAAILDNLDLSAICTWLGKSEEVNGKVYQLFQGNTDVFEESRIEFLIQYQKLQNKLEDMDPDSQWNPSDIVDSIPEVTPEEKAAFPKPTYEYAYYSGTKGKIVEVKSTFTWYDTTYTIVEYYREGSDYGVFAGFADSEELSPGDIALWVADSLEVEEHFPE
jgi:hypothetical protein